MDEMTRKLQGAQRRSHIYMCSVLYLTQWSAQGLHNYVNCMSRKALQFVTCHCTGVRFTILFAFLYIASKITGILIYLVFIHSMKLCKKRLQELYVLFFNISITGVEI